MIAGAVVGGTVLFGADIIGDLVSGCDALGGELVQGTEKGLEIAVDGVAYIAKKTEKGI